MSKYLIALIILINISCKQEKIGNEFVISFGSCNNQNLSNDLWKEIEKNEPDLFLWGGDIIYADDQDIDDIKKAYTLQKNNPVYANFKKNVMIMGTWDDHDYGLNDGGREYKGKDQVQQLLLDFFDVPDKDPKRNKKGVYHSKNITVEKGTINIIILDTRYFRTALTKDSTGQKRYIPNDYGFGSILGEKQWKWLEEELNSSDANFNIIVSSIQFLSKEHGFETWGNMPHEVDKLKEIISNSNANGVIILSGDRHIAEISKDSLSGKNYPLIDITSSGLTHSYTSFKGEPNQYRIGNVVSELNFGILIFDFENNTVNMEIRGKDNIKFQSYIQKY